MAVTIVADDLTGAMDAAGPFARSSCTPRVCWETKAGSLSAPGPPQILAWTSASRHLPANEAATAARRTTERATRHGPDVVFKKIDSTLRGNFAVEVAAALRATGRRHALIAPAVPSQGRALVDGELRVHGVALKRNPNAPGHERSVTRPDVALAQGAPHLQVRAVADPAKFALPDVSGDTGTTPIAHVIDCATDADLRAVAAAGLIAPQDVLFVGASGLSKAIADLMFGDAVPFAKPPNDHQTGPVLFVVGSLADASRRQVETLRSAIPRVAEVVPTTDTASLPPIPEAIPAILLRTDPDTSDAPPIAIAQRLANWADAVIVAHRPRAVVLTGGDTAQAVFVRLGLSCVDVAGEAAPGVVVGRCRLGGRTAHVVTKAGGFGAKHLFLDLMDRL